MRVDDLTSIVRLAGIKRTVTEAGEQDDSERQAAIAKLKKMTSGNEYNDANHTYIDPKTGAIIYSRDGSPMPASNFTDPKYTGSVGSELRNLLKQSGLSVTADARGNARVDPAAFANLGREPVAPSQSTAGSSGAAAPANNSGVTTSGIPPVRITTPGSTAAPSQQAAEITPMVANPDTKVSARADYEGDTPASSGGGQPAMPAAEPAAKKKQLAPVNPAIMALQKKLKALGADLGGFGPNKDGIDGRMGGKTARAIELFDAGKLPGQSGAGPSGPGPAGPSGPLPAGPSGPLPAGPSGPGLSGATPVVSPKTKPGPKPSKYPASAVWEREWGATLNPDGTPKGTATPNTPSKAEVKPRPPEGAIPAVPNQVEPRPADPLQAQVWDSKYTRTYDPTTGKKLSAESIELADLIRLMEKLK
jgi:hypothetical protein